MVYLQPAESSAPLQSRLRDAYLYKVLVARAGYYVNINVLKKAAGTLSVKLTAISRDRNLHKSKKSPRDSTLSIEREG